jgi:serine/threonine-protein kinase
MSDDEGATEPDPGASRRRARERLSEARYHLGDAIGKGGMGEVLNARDVHLHREVAIKRIRNEDPSDRATDRFLREARIQGRLDHPAIVPVYELGQDASGRPFFAMKKLTGTTLAQILDGPSAEASREKLLRAFADVCLAVAFAHSRGVIHRDLKPQNIMLGDFGEVYVIDWGVAKLAGEIERTESGESDEMATGDGIAIGTPGYMAPEQIKDSASIDERADIYSLGCVLFEILARTPLHPKGRVGMLSAVSGVDVRTALHASEQPVPPELEDVCVQMTASSRDERPRDARVLSNKILEYLDGDRDLARRRELASTHLARAREAYERRDNEEARRTAIREAGRALGLDPTLAGAAELVGRLMLEPPRAMPREVEDELRADAIETDRRQARISIWISTGYLAFVPFILLANDWLYAALLVAYLAFNTVVLRLRARSARGQHPYTNAMRNAVLVAIVAHAFSPPIVGPGLAAATVGALLLTASYTRPRALFGLVAILSAAVVVPWAAEWIGVLGQTVFQVDGGVALRSPVLDAMGPLLRDIALGIYTFGILAATAAIGNAMVQRDRTSRRHLYLQAWQLRQLVPA